MVNTVSHCPSLNVFSAGNTEIESLEAIRSALTLYTLALYKQNRLDEKLLTTGFFPVDDPAALPKAKQFVAVENGKENLQYVEVDIPLLLAKDGQEADSLAHA